MASWRMREIQAWHRVLSRIVLSLVLVLVSGAGAVIDSQEREALTQVVEDLGVPVELRWPPQADPCSTWSKYATCDANQTHVIGLKLNSLELLGILPPALGNLTRLTSVDMSNNFLHGTIPPALGSLTNLNTLILGLNNLTGPIPDEIGRLQALDALYLDNNNLSGRIPASIGNLTRLTGLHLYCNGLEGQIPAEIGNLAKLTDFQVHSNKLSGELPATLSYLTKLSAARLNNNQLSGSLNLTLLQALGGGGLKILHLHRNNFSGLIPDMDMSGFPALEELNLGFNQLSGPLPRSLGSMALLSILFIGHNQLEGPLPGSYTNLQNLKTFDVSHNALSGSLSAVSNLGLLQAARQFDFSFNNFMLGDIPSSLVQGNNTLFNCLDNPPVQSVAPPAGSVPSAPSPSPAPPCVSYLAGRNLAFAINAGSRDNVTNNDGVTFESDSALQDGVTTGIQEQVAGGDWAVQVSGTGGGAFASPVQVAGSSDNVMLYQTMRWSSQYLAYYGRNMRHGTFRVKLYFAELNFKRPGYRVFDVLVQGQVIKSSLDVVAVAGPNTALVVDLPQVVVEDGLLRIELVHVSPINRWIDPAFNIPETGPMISAISVQPVNLWDAPQEPQSPPGVVASIGSSRGTVVVVLAVLGAILFALVVSAIAFLCLCRRRAKQPPPLPAGAATKSTRGQGRNSSATQGSSTPSELSDIGPTFYSYAELFAATKGFSEENKLGQGGFGSVYKGVFADGSVVAIKQLTIETQQSIEAFRKEIAIISSVQHRNLLSLRGCCLDAELPLLVCEYMPNGSLDRLLHGRDSRCPDWESRRNIAIGAACGLAYLHDESKHRIIHCDVKPANILLDRYFNARIADFGLARLYDEGNSHITTTKIQGTRGYLAPEYALHLQLSDKADVYAFGIVLLELLSGRHIMEPGLPSEKVVLVDWAQELGQQGSSSLLKLLDPRLAGQHPDEQQVLDMATVANWCTQAAPNLRPKMRTVWLMLNGTIGIPDLPGRRETTTVKAILSASSALPMAQFQLDSNTAWPQSGPQTASSSHSHTTGSSSSSGAAAQFVAHEEIQIANLLSRDGLTHADVLT